MDIRLLEIQYSDIVERATRLRETAVEQLSKILDGVDVTLGVPLESRVKEWSSIVDKIERNRLAIDSIDSLSDLIGIRTILLFRADLQTVHELINENFDVVSSEDTAERLGDARFGYQSQHYVVKLPKSWLGIPSFADLGDLQVEVQVRTLAQHIWAAASHKLQYKNEASVPPPLRRTINRVSALLETADLEFDRVLSERKNYLETGIAETTGAELLNVDLLKAILANAFPPENHVSDDAYEDFLRNLSDLSVRTADDLQDLLDKHHDKAIEDEEKEVQRRLDHQIQSGNKKGIDDHPVFYTHVGLARRALRYEFGSRASALYTKYYEPDD